MSAAPYAPGAMVAVLNCTMGGRFIVEGQAKVIRCTDAENGRYLVEFHDGTRTERFVEADAQSDPFAFAEALNAARPKEVHANV